MQLNGHVNDLLRIFGGSHLGHGRFLGDALALIAQPSGAVSEQSSGIQQSGHLRQFALGDLKISQGTAKHFALLGPRNGLVQGSARKSKRRTCHRCSEHIQSGHGHFETLATRTYSFGMWHPHIVETQSGQWMGRHHVDALGNLKSWHIGIHNECADAPSTWRITCARKHHVKIGNSAIGNPSLETIQAIAVGRFNGTALHGRHV